MSYRDLARIPVRVGETNAELRDALERANKTINGLMDQVNLLKAQQDAQTLQGLEISTTAPTNGQVLTWDATAETWGPETP